MTNLMWFISLGLRGNMECLELKSENKCAGWKQTLPAFRAVSEMSFGKCRFTICKSCGRGPSTRQPEHNAYFPLRVHILDLHRPTLSIWSRKHIHRWLLSRNSLSYHPFHTWKKVWNSHSHIDDIKMVSFQMGFFTFISFLILGNVAIHFRKMTRWL